MQPVQVTLSRFVSSSSFPLDLPLSGEGGDTAILLISLTRTHAGLVLPYLGSRRVHVSSRKTLLSMHIRELRARRPHCPISSFTAHEPEGFCLTGRSEGTDYNVIRMAMIAGIDCGRGENHQAMWLRCFWYFDAYLVVEALRRLRKLMSSCRLLASKSICEGWCEAMVEIQYRITGGKVHAPSEFGERSGPERVRVPERPGAREGNRDRRNGSLEAMARKRKEEKEGLYCIGSTMAFAGAREEGYIQVCYTSRGGRCRPVSGAR